MSERADRTPVWDCVVVGGGAAGLSAGLVLGRARRATLIVDAGGQSNLAAQGIGGLLGFDGRPPAQLYAAGRRELDEYPSVRVRDGRVEDAERRDDGFALTLADGERVRARTVLLATGMDYARPEVAGLEALWGRSAFHCPFCHGWEARDAPMAVLARGDRALHTALLLRGWTDDVVVTSDGPAGLSADAAATLAAAGIRVDERRIEAFVGPDGELTEIRFADGTSLARGAVLVATELTQRGDLAARLGVITRATRISPDSVVVDEFGRTSVRGVFAAGDVASVLPQVAAAVAAGSQAGAAVVQSLLADDVGLPVPPWPRHDEAARV